MLTQRHIETKKAKKLRSLRQHYASTGGSHDKLIEKLNKGLPIGVGVVAALMIFTPLSPGKEVSFLLDRNKVALIDERLAVENAMYRGQDDSGRPFSITAGNAVQRSSREGVVRMRNLVAQILLRDGPARISAAGGVYDIEEETIKVDGPLTLSAKDGYSMTASGVSVDLKTRLINGEGRVAGAVTAGQFAADKISVDIDERKISLTGNARLTMNPGELRVPQ